MRSPDDVDAPFRVASFGAGWVTTNRHIPTMRGVPGFEVKAVVDRRDDRASAVSRALHVPRWAAASRLSDTDLVDSVDAVTCGTAPFSHREVVLDALRCGKHVLTEKPFAMSLQEGREMVDEAARANRTLAVVHNFQFAASTRRARRWIDEGRLGAVRGLVAVQYSNPHRRLPEWTEQLPLGLFYDESPHLLYMVRDLAPGPLEALRATTYPSTLGLPATPAQVELQLVAGDVPVTVLMNFEAPVSEWHVNILGEHALCSIDLFRDIAVLIPNDGRHSTLEVLRSSVAATAGHWMGHGRSGWGHLRKRLRYGNDEVFARFMRASRSATAPIGISGADALEVLELQHWVIDQAETVRGPV